MNELTEIAIEIFDFLECKRPMTALTAEEEAKFHKAKVCHICKKYFVYDDDEPQYAKVRDHCHLSGLYRGPAHQTCNLQYQISRNIPVVMHNLSGYDSHLIIKKLASNKQINGKITIIPHNSEK